jgi:hypothetical protein
MGDEYGIEELWRSQAFGEQDHRRGGVPCFVFFFFYVGVCSRHIKPWRDMPTLLTRAGITTVETT